MRRVGPATERVACWQRRGAHSRASPGHAADSRSLSPRFLGASNLESEFLAGAEKRDLLGVNLDQLPGFGIAALPGATLLHRETAEAANLDPPPAHQRIGHRVEHRVDDGLALAMREAPPARQQFLDDFPLGHRSSNSWRRAREGLRPACAIAASAARHARRHRDRASVPRSRYLPSRTAPPRARASGRLASLRVLRAA